MVTVLAITQTLMIMMVCHDAFPFDATEDGDGTIMQILMMMNDGFTIQ